MEAMAIMEQSLNQTTSKGLFKLTVSSRCRLRGLTAQFSPQEQSKINYHLHKHKKNLHIRNEQKKLLMLYKRITNMSIVFHDYV